MPNRGMPVRKCRSCGSGLIVRPRVFPPGAKADVIPAGTWREMETIWEREFGSSLGREEDDEEEFDSSLGTEDEDKGKPTPEENRMRRYDEIERKAWPRSSAKKHADNDEHEFGVEAEEGEASKVRTHYHVWEYASGGSPRRTIAIFDERSSAERHADEHVSAFEEPYVARGDARSGYSITSTVSDYKADLGAIRIEACELDGCMPDV